MKLRPENDGLRHIDFPALWKTALTASVAIVVVSILALVVRGLDLGIDFEGGTSFEVQTAASVDDVENALPGNTAAEARIQEVTDSDGTRFVRVRSSVEEAGEVDEIRSALSEVGTITAFESVGPTWGSEITSKATSALIWFFIAIAIYISVRLEWRMAIGALAAVAHDIIISVGVYAIFGFEVTPATVIAFLTIMGYSLYDTIVVYDKVREITARVGATGRYTYTEMMNLALNQVLARSINTTITSIIPVISMLVIGSFILGATTLQEFSIALLVGLLVGGYSSLFVASAVVARLKEQEPEYQQIAKKVAKKGGGEGTRRIAPEDATLGVQAGRMRNRSGGTATATAPKKTKKPAGEKKADSSDDSTDADEPKAKAKPKGTSTPPAAGGSAIPPRPRKTKRKK